IGEREGLVGGDGVLDAPYRGQEGAAAGGHQDVARRVAPAAHLDGVGLDDAGPPLDQRDPGVAKQAQVDAVEPVELPVLGRDEAGPIEAGLPREAPAEAGGVGEVVVEVGSVDQELLGDAAAEHAGAAHPDLLADGHAGAVRAGAAAGGDAAGSGADGEQVEVVLGHGPLVYTAASAAWTC